jgi:hypothetical protein
MKARRGGPVVLPVGAAPNTECHLSRIRHSLSVVECKGQGGDDDDEGQQGGQKAEGR